MVVVALALNDDRSEGCPAIRQGVSCSPGRNWTGTGCGQDSCL